MCNIENCTNKIVARGWCGKHYQRWQKYGNPTKILRDGYSYLPEYHVWKDIKRRCYNPNFKQFDDYGGRGIKMCDEWRNSFKTFLIDIGERPVGNYWIERINNNGNYEPANCRWATTAEQAINRRSNRLATAFGRTQTLKEWTSESGLKKSTLAARLRYGWTLERALTTKVRA